MNFHTKGEKECGEEVFGGDQQNISRISVVPIPVSSGQNDSDDECNDVSMPFFKTKSVEISRQTDKSMQFWSGSHADEQQKPCRDSQLDYQNLNQSEPTASTTHNNQSATPSDSFNGQEIKPPDQQTAFDDKTNLTEKLVQMPSKQQVEEGPAPSTCQSQEMDQRHKDFAKELFQLQNKTRKEPKWIIKHLKTQIKRFQGLKLYSHTEQEFIKLSKQNKNVSVTFVQTQEGQKVYQEAISYLEKQRQLPPLKWSQALFKACKDHVQNIGPGGITSTSGQDQEKPIGRLKKYGNLDQCWSWADSCIFGAINPLEAFERLLVCDGQPQRGFRHAIFNQDFKLCGISCFDHYTHENVIQLLYVDKILQLNQPKENNVPEKSHMREKSDVLDKCDLLELAMNSDVYIVCKELKSQVKKEIELAANPVTISVPIVPRSVRSPVDFKQPPKVTRNPTDNTIATSQTAQQMAPMAPSISQKSLASGKSPKVIKENAELFDKEGNLIGSEKQNFGIQLKQYTENKQQSIWFTNKKNSNQCSQLQQTPKTVPPKTVPPQTVQTLQTMVNNQQKKLASQHKRLFSKDYSAVKTLQVKLPPSLRQSKNQVKPSFSPRYSPKKTLETHFKNMNTPSCTNSRSPPLRIERSYRKPLYPNGSPGKPMRSARQTTTSNKSPTWNNSVSLRQKKEAALPQNQLSESKIRNNKTSPQQKNSESKSKQDQLKDDKGMTLKDTSRSKEDSDKFIELQMEVKQQTERNPLSAQQTVSDPVKTFKFDFNKNKDNDSMTQSNLKSPTRCATTGTTSGNVGSLTRVEGIIVNSNKSFMNDRCRSPLSLGSKIGAGLQKICANSVLEDKAKNVENVQVNDCSDKMNQRE